MTDQPLYRTASYLADPHPEDPEHQPLWVELTYCTRCGAIVHDEMQHGFWHDLTEVK